jgi:hypothetical protein
MSIRSMAAFTDARPRRGARRQPRDLKMRTVLIMFALIAAQALGWPATAGEVDAPGRGNHAFKTEDFAVSIDRPGTLQGSNVLNVAISVSSRTSSSPASIRSTLDIDCVQSRVLIKRTERFGDYANTKASEKILTAPRWVKPTPNAYLSGVIQHACSRLSSPEAADTITGDDAPAALTEALVPSKIPTPPKVATLKGQSALAAGSSPDRPPTILSTPDVARSKSRFLVQLLSSPNSSLVNLAVQTFAGQQHDLMNGREIFVQQAIVGDVTYYRMRVGYFVDKNAATRFCQAIQPSHSGCMVFSL